MNEIKGAGLGLRSEHCEAILRNPGVAGWFEVLADNYYNIGGAAFRQLEKIRADHPFAFHSVGMSLGSPDPIDRDYLKQAKELQRIFQPTWISDHLCWTSLGNAHLHDLLPLPFNDEMVRQVVDKIRATQDFLERRLLIENVSSYATFKASTLTEWQFLLAVAEGADCDILFDVNNVYVSATNHGFDSLDYIRGVDALRVKQYHLAGYEDRGTHLIDTHGSSISEPVWELFQKTVAIIGDKPTIIERDSDIPDFKELCLERERAQQILEASRE